MRRHHIALPLSLLLVTACGKKDDDKDDPTTNVENPDGGTGPGGSDTGDNGDNGGGGGNTNKIKVAGKLAGASLHLTDGTVTHIVARDTSKGSVAVAEVDATGAYELNIEREKPWVITYIDDTKTGVEKIVGTFASETLDMLAPSADAKDFDMGTVDLTSGKTETTQGRSDLLAAIGMTEAGAGTLGALDDSGLRYSNPDIDGDGHLDATQGENGTSIDFTLDFHNRFDAKHLDDTPYNNADLVNAFADAANVKFGYTGTGVIPWFKTSVLGGVAPTAYTWSFSQATKLGTNGGAVCTGYSAGDMLPANTECSLTYSSTAGESYFTPGVEVALPEDGTYTLRASGKTLTWTNVRVSDFSAGEGFLALFTRYDVVAGKMTGVSHKWMKRQADGSYALATQEDVDLVIKKGDNGTCGYISFKMDNAANGQVGVSLSCKPEDSVVFATAIAGTASDVVNVGPDSTYTLANIAAGLPAAAFLASENVGTSYDDKLGMRFFF